MDSAMLASETVATLSAILGGTASGAAQAVGAELYAELRQKMAGDAHAEQALTNLATNPTSGEAMADVRSAILAALAVDPTLGQRLVTALNRGTPGIAGSPSKAIARGSSTAIGRDSLQTTIHTNSHNTTTTKNSHNKKTSYGGLVVAILVVVVVIVVAVVGRTVVNFIGRETSKVQAQGLSAASTCTDFLASADSIDKVQTMKKLFLQYNQVERAGDPFLLQNVEYHCSHVKNPSAVTLGAVAKG